MLKKKTPPEQKPRRHIELWEYYPEEHPGLVCDVVGTALLYLAAGFLGLRVNDATPTGARDKEGFESG